MARKGQQKRVIGINVTEAQWQAVEAAYQKDKAEHDEIRRHYPDYPEINKNDMLLRLLAEWCDDRNIPWPEYTSQQGKRTDLEDNS